MPPHVKPDMLPEHWYCRDNIYDPRKNTCDAPEENQVEAVIQNSVGDLKQVRAEERKKEKEAKRREEEQKRLEAESKRAEEEQKRKHIEEQQRILKLREEELQRKNKEIEEIKRAREAKKKAKEAQRRAALEEGKKKEPNPEFELILDPCRKAIGCAV
jgi:predicted Zn-dependent protease